MSAWKVMVGRWCAGLCVATGLLFALLPAARAQSDNGHPRFSLGLKGGFLPLNDMNAERPGGVLVDYDFGLILGWGAAASYRLAANFYLMGEAMLWYPRVDDTSDHPQRDESGFGYPEADWLFNVGLGLRYNVLGSERTTDRLYIKGHFGFADYVAAQANADADNREGYYFNLLVGIEHMFSRRFTVYAETGYADNVFASPGDAETDASLNGWLATGGFAYHWGN